MSRESLRSLLSYATFCGVFVLSTSTYEFPAISQFLKEPGAPVIEEEVLAFVHTEIGSVSALELLLFVKRGADRSWPLRELVLALRSSSTAVAQACARLQNAGLLTERPDGT